MAIKKDAVRFIFQTAAEASEERNWKVQLNKNELGFGNNH